MKRALALLAFLFGACSGLESPTLEPTTQAHTVAYPRLVTAPPELAGVTKLAIQRWNEAAGEEVAAWVDESAPGVAEVVAVPEGEKHRAVQDDGETRIEVSADAGPGLLLHELGHYLLARHLIAPGSCMGYTDDRCEIAQESIDQVLEAKRNHAAD